MHELQIGLRILVGGRAPLVSTTNNWASAFGVARLDSSGALDATFGNGGTLTTTFSGDDDSLDALVEQRDGKIVAVGTTGFTDATGNLAFGLALARYVP